MKTDTPIPVKLAEYAPYPFEIAHVTMAFQLDPKKTIVETTLEVLPTGNSTDMLLDGVALELLKVSIDGEALGAADYIRTDETLTLKSVPKTPFILTTRVSISPESNKALSGLYISAGRFCTQCEANGFRRITFFPDRPDVMSRFKVRLEADNSYPFLLCNGTPGNSGALDGGRHFAEWDDPHPKPAYLFALCAGDYDVYRDTFETQSGAKIDLAIHVDKGDADRAAWAMDSLKRSMRWDETEYGREYDLGVFNIVAVRDFNFGAMENKGLNIFNSAYVLADSETATDTDFEAIESIVAHEYFHNWTGNRVTCRDWFQLCLKEGLTVFRDQSFSADMRSAPVQRIKDVIRLRARQFPEDAGPLAHAVRPSTYGSVDNLYTATVYEKGAELIGMLKGFIGDKVYREAMDLYFQRHDGQAVTIEDFYACFETAAGRDFSHFLNWYRQPGTPDILATESWDATAGELTISLEQKNRKTSVVSNPMPLPVPVKYAAFASTGEKLTEDVFVLDKTHGEIKVSAAARPLVSLNRGFSAPIRLEHTISNAQLIALASIDDDPFNKWDIFQSLLKQDLLAIAYENQADADSMLIDALARAINGDAETDPAYAALLCRLPDVGELMVEQVPANPAELDRARQTVRRQLAHALAPLTNAVLKTPSPTPYHPGAEQAGIRALRCAIIALLDVASSDASETARAEYAAATNMTERLAGLSVLVRIGGEHAKTALLEFEERWVSNPLVMDKWFAVQAAHVDVDAMRALLSHKGYDPKNPNCVRSLIGVFAMRNLAAFHTADGAGYALLKDVIIKTDRFNPALAARLLTSFEQWRSLVPDVQTVAKEALAALEKANLSKNSADILRRTLSAP